VLDGGVVTPPLSSLSVTPVSWTLLLPPLSLAQTWPLYETIATAWPAPSGTNAFVQHLVTLIRGVTAHVQEAAFVAGVSAWGQMALLPFTVTVSLFEQGFAAVDAYDPL